MTRKKKPRVKLLPKRVTDVDPIIRWGIRTRLKLIEEVACGPQASVTGAPGMDEGMKGFLQLLGRDWKANEEAIVDYMRVEVRKWWQDFPERQLLTGLYERDTLWKAKSGPPDSRRRPSRAEGLQVATPLLADIRHADRFDPEWESEAVPTFLAALLLPPIGLNSPSTLRDYIERSEASRTYFDALVRMYEEIQIRGQLIPRPLFGWRQEVAGGHRRRPERNRRQAHRPVNPAKLLRDIQIQFTIEVLRKVGVPPTGDPVSGCRIVSEALELSEDPVRLSEDATAKIWGKRIWKGPSQQMQKHWKATAERTGPFHTTED